MRPALVARVAACAEHRKDRGVQQQAECGPGSNAIIGLGQLRRELTAVEGEFDNCQHEQHQHRASPYR